MKHYETIKKQETVHTKTTCDKCGKDVNEHDIFNYNYDVQFVEADDELADDDWYTQWQYWKLDLCLECSREVRKLLEEHGYKFNHEKE